MNLNAFIQIEQTSCSLHEELLNEVYKILRKCIFFFVESILHIGISKYVHMHMKKYLIFSLDVLVSSYTKIWQDVLLEFVMLFASTNRR